MARLFATYIVALQSYSKRNVGIVFFLTLLALASIITGLILINNKFLVEKPLPGGAIFEGVIGSPYAINPVLAVSQTDKDLTALIFSGLTRKGNNGTIINDLAKEYTLSNDGLTYTFTLKDDLVFHDNKPLTAYDIAYTIDKVQDASVRSPHRLEWEGIEVKIVDEKTIQFVLKKPFPDFLKNTSIGILPKHLFEDNPNEAFSVLSYNTEPIGSGPFKITPGKITRKNGVPVAYTLDRNEKFALGAPLLETIHIQVFDTEEAVANALKRGDVTSASSLSAEYAHLFIEGGNLEARRSPLPRAFGLFLNQNKVKALQDIKVREALNTSLDRALITYETFYGFGTPVVSAAPLAYRVQDHPIQESKETIMQMFLDAGWSKNDAGILNKKGESLKFTIATIDIPELKTIAEFVRNTWQDLGIEVTIDVYSLGDLRDILVADRSFDILLYGIVVDEDADLYTYWHSSGRTHPGLNVSQYVNKRVDTILESIKNGLATGTDVEAVLDQIKSDIPAIFLFSPDFIYITEKKLHGVDIQEVENAEDRFNTVYMWYRDTERVWPALLHLPYLKQAESFIYSL
ncbi:MAG: peptide ABC transporter substrate-binding protein [Minisyncoccia bacterium]